MPLFVRVTCPCDERAITALAEGLVALNFVQMWEARQAGTPVPPLYSSGVRYQRERPGQEQWQSAAELLSNGVGDCEDLASYRAAELRCEGEPATVLVVRTERGTFHAIVRRQDGTTEDPSRILLEMAGDRKTEV